MEDGVQMRSLRLQVCRRYCICTYALTLFAAAAAATMFASPEVQGNCIVACPQQQPHDRCLCILRASNSKQVSCKCMQKQCRWDILGGV